MALTDLAVFNEYAYESMIEVLDQKVDLFNSATEGTIVLKSGGLNIGDYDEKAMFKLLGNMIRDRDPADNTTVVAPRKLEHIKKVSVKVGQGTPPVDLSTAQFDWIKIDPKQAGAAVGQSIAVGQLERYLNTSLGICKSVYTNNPLLTLDASTAKQVPVNFVKASALFGDRSGQIKAWVSHSIPMHDVWANNLTNAQNLFTYGNVTIMRDPFGKLFIMTDCPDLVITGSPNKYVTLGLTEGAIEMEQNADFRTNIDSRNGLNNIQTTMQSEWSYNVGLKGYSWDIANGGSSPTNAELKTATNWDQYVSHIKDTGGIAIKTL